MFRQVLMMGGVGLDAQVRMAGGVGSGCAEEGGEGGDGFEQQGLGAGLLVGCAAGMEVGYGVAVLGLGGELADAGGDGRVNAGRAARAGASRG